MNKKVVLITGTSTGIGRATALAFLEAGFITVATARDTSDVKDLQEKGCVVRQLDVTSETSMDQAVQSVEDQYGPIHVLVNNAGAPCYGPVEEISMHAIRTLFETNVFGLIRMCQLVIPGMRRAGGGRIINVSSVAGRISQPGAGIYHASKHAVEAIDEALRAELKAFNIEVIGVLPGPVDTPFRDKLLRTIPNTGPDSPYLVFKENLKAYMQKMMDNPTTLSAEDVAKTVVEAATAEKPDTRYNVGLPAKILPVVRGLTPDRVWDTAYLAMVPPENS